jgi:RNase P subunit RPR2
MLVLVVTNLSKKNHGLPLEIVLNAKLNIDKMKIFKCGNCKTPYKLDEKQFNSPEIVVTCLKCGAKNSIKFGPMLVVTAKDGNQSRFFLKKGANYIGRKITGIEEGHMYISDIYISRKHAIVYAEQKEGKWFFSIEDCKSTNGTFNQLKIKLKPGLKYPFPPESSFIIGLSKITLKIN